MQKRLKLCKDYLMMIDSLSNQQAIYAKNTKNWLKVEHNIVEIECKLFNELLLFDFKDTEFMFNELPILSILALHLFKYFDMPEFMNEITLLSPGAILLIGMLGNTFKGHGTDHEYL